MSTIKKVQDNSHEVNLDDCYTYLIVLFGSNLIKMALLTVFTTFALISQIANAVYYNAQLNTWRCFVDKVVTNYVSHSSFSQLDT